MNAVGIDLGGTEIKAVLVDANGNVLQRKSRSTDDAAGEAGVWAERMKTLVDKLGGAECPVGISAPGLVAKDGRSIAHMPGRLHGLEGLDWTEFLGRTAAVPVLNDAHASLLGERWLGAAREFDDCFLLTLGTGVGGAILSGGRLLRGHIGRAGHLGHISLDWLGQPDIVGTPGSLEDLVGNHNILQRTQGRFQSTLDLIAACSAGDPRAARYWKQTVRSLAAGIVSLVNVLDPEAVILGGGIAEAGTLLFDPLRSAMDELEWRPAGHAVKLIPAELGRWAGAVGAAREAMLGK